MPLFANTSRLLVRTFLHARKPVSTRQIYYNWAPQYNGRHAKHRGVYRWVAALTIPFLLDYLSRPGDGGGSHGHETGKSGAIHGMSIRKLPMPTGIYMQHA